MTVTVFLTTLLAVSVICRGQQQQPTCDSANATLWSESDCRISYQAFIMTVQNGVRSPDNKTLRIIHGIVCNETSPCRSDILDYQNSCSATEEVEAETAAIVQAEAEETLFGCILHEMAGSCLIVSANIEGGLNGFANNYFLGDIHKCLMTYYNGMCSKECNQNITRFVNQWGCCYAEFVRILAQKTESVSPEHYAVSVRDYFTFCDLPVLPSFCMLSDNGAAVTQTANILLVLFLLVLINVIT